MNRRNFIQTGALGVAAAGLSSPLSAEGRIKVGKHTFKHHYAPHEGMFRHHGGKEVLDQLRFIADTGFTAFEDNGMRGRPVGQQQAIGDLLAQLGMTMGVFVAHNIAWNDANLASGDSAKRDQFLAEVRESVEVAKRCNAKWMTVVPGALDKRLALDYQTANVVEALRRAAEILEPHGLIMVLEPLNPFRDHPGLFLSRSPQAYLVCRAVNSPSCKILFDIYHQQITEGNLIPNIEKCWDEIAYFQIGDNPGRNEPSTGEINYRRVFEFIYKKGFRGVLGMEHGNSMPDKAGELAVINAYVEADKF
ncbi:MAG TPA: TIM barrel protein [Rhodothermales bacterium]|nr:TIM barrel protein [Rhodothermales bacterium]